MCVYVRIIGLLVYLYVCSKGVFFDMTEVMLVFHVPSLWSHVTCM